MIDSNTISITAGIASIILAIVAIFFTVWFFVLSKKSEKETSNSLTEIKTQATSLQTLTGKLMDRLTRYVTTDKPNPMEIPFQQLVSALAQIPQSITANFTQTTVQSIPPEVIKELHILYIGLYYYTATSNVHAQFYLPSTENFDETNSAHQVVKRFIDTSHNDFKLMEDIINKCERNKLETSQVVHLLKEVENFWGNLVKSAADVLIQREKNAQQTQ